MEIVERKEKWLEKVLTIKTYVDFLSKATSNAKDKDEKIRLITDAATNIKGVLPHLFILAKPLDDLVSLWAAVIIVVAEVYKYQINNEAALFLLFKAEEEAIKIPRRSGNSWKDDSPSSDSALSTLRIWADPNVGSWDHSSITNEDIINYLSQATNNLVAYSSTFFEVLKAAQKASEPVAIDKISRPDSWLDNRNIKKLISSLQNSSTIINLPEDTPTQKETSEEPRAEETASHFPSSGQQSIHTNGITITCQCDASLIESAKFCHICGKGVSTKGKLDKDQKKPEKEEPPLENAPPVPKPPDPQIVKSSIPEVTAYQQAMEEVEKEGESFERAKKEFESIKEAYEQAKEKLQQEKDKFEQVTEKRLEQPRKDFENLVANISDIATLYHIWQFNIDDNKAVRNQLKELYKDKIPDDATPWFYEKPVRQYKYLQVCWSRTIEEDGEKVAEEGSIHIGNVDKYQAKGEDKEKF